MNFEGRPFGMFFESTEPIAGNQQNIYIIMLIYYTNDIDRLLMTDIDQTYKLSKKN